MFFYILCGIWYYFQVTIIGLSSPLGASLYNIGMRLCSQRTTSSSSKCKMAAAFYIQRIGGKTKTRLEFNRNLIVEATFG